jgi:hypothetical protein
MSRRKPAGYIVEAFGPPSCGYGNLDHRKLTPQQAIKFYCWDCQGGHEFPWRMADGKVEKPLRPTDEVRGCESTTCWLYPFRHGRNPYSRHRGHADSIRKVPKTR